MATATQVRPRSVPGITLGTTAQQIRDFRDKHLSAPADSVFDPQALQAWALLERAAIAQEANQIALLLNDGDALAVQAEVERISLGLGGAVMDLSLLLVKAEAVIQNIETSPDDDPLGADALDALKTAVADLRKKFGIVDPRTLQEAVQRANVAAGAEATVSQADGAAGEVTGCGPADGGADVGDETK